MNSYKRQQHGVRRFLKLCRQYVMLGVSVPAAVFTAAFVLTESRSLVEELYTAFSPLQSFHVPASEMIAPEASAPEALIQEWVSASALSDLAPGAIAAFSSDACPTGWERITTDQAAPLFMAIGLLTDETGSPYNEATSRPYSSFSILTACEKR